MPLVHVLDSGFRIQTMIMEYLETSSRKIISVLLIIFISLSTRYKYLAETTSPCLKDNWRISPIKHLTQSSRDHVVWCGVVVWEATASIHGSNGKGAVNSQDLPRDVVSTDFNEAVPSLTSSLDLVEEDSTWICRHVICRSGKHMG